MKGFRPFKMHRILLYCVVCHVELGPNEWESHYRTKIHRYNKALALALS